MVLSKIAMISEHASPLAVLGGVDSGGQNVYVAQIARHLGSHGIRVDVFTRRETVDQPEIQEFSSNVRVIQVPAGPAKFIRKEELLPYMEEFYKVVLDRAKSQKKPYDLLHAHFWMSGLVAMKIKQELGIPYVVTFHALGKVRRMYQGKSDDFPDARLDIEDHVAMNADGIIAECPQDGEDLIHFYNVLRNRLYLVPCGFEPDEFYPMDKSTARSKLHLPADGKIILQLGRMVPRKGVDIAIRGLACLARSYNLHARLLIVGGESENPDPLVTPEIGRLEMIAQEEGVHDRVTFVGRRGRHDLKYFYNAADVFVTTPWYEPFGITPLEAMACGTPVIGSRVGGIKYTVEDGVNGFLIPPNAPDRLAERLAWLFNHPERISDFGRNGIRRVNQHFTWESVSQQMIDVYERVSISAGSREPGHPMKPERMRAKVYSPSPSPVSVWPAWPGKSGARVRIVIDKGT